jgi:intergrase/recombinase
LEAEKELEWREECRLHDIQRAEEDRIRKIFEARKEKEVVKTRKLFSDAKKFNKAAIYRNFINATEQKAIKENNLSEELKEWIKWANDKADWMDPTSPQQDELLNDNDIDEIENPKKTNYYYR